MHFTDPYGNHVTPGPGQEVRTRTGIYAVVLQGPALLCVHSRDLKVWEFPGGGQDAGEDDAATLQRELREEGGFLQVHVGPMVLQLEQDRYDPTDNTFAHHFSRYYAVDVGRQDRRFIYRSHVDQWGWFTPSQIRRLRFSARHWAALASVLSVPVH